MKKFSNIFALSVVVCFLSVACGSKKEESAPIEQDEYGANEIPQAGPSFEETIAEGKALVESSDCGTCHHPTNMVIGPAHADVAKKYEFTQANVKMLAEKILKGGSGVWGDVMMNPHPDLSQAEAEKMVRYVLSLDGEEEKQ